jgi:outer membrane protein assembly factor BamB
MRTGLRFCYKNVALFIVIASWVLTTGCGGGTPATSMALERQAQVIPTSVDLSQALSELDALAAPDGVDPALFIKLQSSLHAMLLQRAAGKSASTAPDTAQSQVDDLIAVRYGSSITMSFTYRNAGDYNQDGIVNSADVGILALHFGKDSSASDWNKALVADDNDSGKVDLGDLTPLAANFGKRVAGYRLNYSSDGAGDWKYFADFAWATSAVPAAGGRRVFKKLLAQLEAGFYQVVPSDGVANGIASNVYHFPASGPAVGGWPMFGGDAQHTRQSPYIGAPIGSLDAVNFVTIVASWNYTRSVVGVDGSIYVGRGRELFAFSATGQLKWRFLTGIDILDPAVIGPDGTVYVSSDYLYALTPDGTRKWSYTEAGEYSGPAIGSDGTIYVTRDNVALAFNADGALKWDYSTPELEPVDDDSPTGPPPFRYRNHLSTPYAGPDNTVYITGYNRELYAINTNGVLRWSNTTAGESIAVGQDGTIYTNSNSGALLALNPNGSLKWKTAEDYAGSIAIGPDGLLYVSCGVDLLAFNLDGSLRWYYPASTQVTAPAFGPDGTVYIGANGKLNAVVEAPGSMIADVLWSATTGYILAPVCGPDGSLYMGVDSTYRDDPTTGANADTLYAFRPDGTTLWTCTAARLLPVPVIGADGALYFWDEGNLSIRKALGYNRQIHLEKYAYSSQPALDADGVVYIGTTGGMLLAYNTDNTLRWGFSAGAAIVSSPVLAGDGTVYVGCEDSRLYAIQSDGTLRWSYTTAAPIVSSPALAIDGTVYVGSRDHTLYAINADGTPRWSYLAGAEIESSPAVGPDGAVYFTSNDGQLHALGATGVHNWSYPADGGANVALNTAGTIYCTGGGSLNAFDPDGTLKWSYPCGSAAVPASPAIGADGTVYIAGGDNTFFALTADGALLMSYQTPAAITSSPVIGPDGKIYIGCNNDMQYAFGN